MDLNDIIEINETQIIDKSEFITADKNYKYFLAEKKGNKIIIRKLITDFPDTEIFFKLSNIHLEKFDITKCEYNRVTYNKKIAYFENDKLEIETQQYFNIFIKQIKHQRAIEAAAKIINDKFIDFIGLYKTNLYLDEHISNNYNLLELPHNFFYYDKKYIIKYEIRCNELWYGNEFKNIEKNNNVNMIMIIFKKYNLCVISMYLDTIYGKNILLNIKELENKINDHDNKDDIIAILKVCNIIVMGNLDNNIDDACYIFSGLLIPRKIYKNENIDNQKTLFTMSTNGPPICVSIINYNVIDTNIEYNDKLTGGKNVAFDCDGVLHTFVGPRNDEGPIVGNHYNTEGPGESYKEELSEEEAKTLFSDKSPILNYPFVRIITKLIDYHIGGNKIYIITSQPHIYGKESYGSEIEVKYIKQLIENYFPFININIIPTGINGLE